MQPSTQTTTIRSILIFLVVGIVLLAVVILGVRWAKGRSDQYAQASNKTPAVAQESQQSQPQPNQQPQQNETQNQPQTQSGSSSQPSTPTVQTPSTGATPQSVPETGAGDLATTIIGFSALAFAGVYYMQSRRKLWRLN